MLALTIFLMSMVAIFGLLDFGADQAASASFQDVGTRLAQSKLAEVEAGAIAITSASSGTFEDEPEWNWSVEPGAEVALNVYPVTVRVWRDVGGRYHEVVLTQLICDPSQMGNASELQPPASSTTTGGM
jgi:hypothetical protein